MDDLKRLIYADPVYEELRKAYEGLKRISETLTYHEDIQVCNVQLATYKEAMQYIKDAPTVDAVEVVHGKWLYDSGSERHFCSACNENALSVTYDEQVADYDWEENLVFRTEPTTKEFWTDYCPNCGARMDGDGNA